MAGLNLSVAQWLGWLDTCVQLQPPPADGQQRPNHTGKIPRLLWIGIDARRGLTGGLLRPGRICFGARAWSASESRRRVRLSHVRTLALQYSPAPPNTHLP
jgi:hypothetical protein